MFGTGKAKKPQPATGNSAPDQPVPDRGGWLSGLGPFGRSQAEGAGGRPGLQLTAVRQIGTRAELISLVPNYVSTGRCCHFGLAGR